MTTDALSIVYPAGTRIAEGKKTLEIRSWLPPRLPLLNLLVVENHISFSKVKVMAFARQKISVERLMPSSTFIQASFSHR